MAKEVMRSNPGHYVALIITLCLTEEEKEEEKRDNNGVRITRVKLLRPTDTLNLGQAYRLIDSQEVMKGLWAKKFAKMKKKKESEPTEQSPRVSENQSSGRETEETSSESGEINQAARPERHRQRTSSALTRSRHWRPSLQSISEAAS
ncbi:Protein of unknown function DUF4228 [Macleaya cordata]|uniref:Uncharacterized protein n=1 Tax=Macleaya cordata TaxID=56857 RepID=A0A200QL92_MACCD|nr:Protein of unknown function DUF4228 [Macleaya cordata]